MQGWQALTGIVVLSSWLLLTPLAWGSSPIVVEPGADGVQRANLQVDNYAFEPSHLVVHVGKAVVLSLECHTFLTPHNFVLRAPEVDLDVAADVGAGKLMTVRFTATRPGRFAFYCDKQLLFFKSHRDKGMEGVLDVRE